MRKQTRKGRREEILLLITSAESSHPLERDLPKRTLSCSSVYICPSKEDTRRDMRGLCLLGHKAKSALEASAAELA